MLPKPRRCLFGTRAIKLGGFLLSILFMGGVVLILNNGDLRRRTVRHLSLSDPIPDKIVKGHILVAAEPFVRAPRTSDYPSLSKVEERDNAYARIQYLLPIPGQPDRLAFNNTRGVLYMTDTNGSPPEVYLDSSIQDIDFCPSYPRSTGLLGFAFHPEFSAEASPARGKFYTAYTMASRDHPDHCDSDVIREWTINDPMADVFRGTSREVFRARRHKNFDHRIGTIAFNPYAHQHSADYGLLYISLGDGSVEWNGQNRSSLYGSLLRIDPRGDKPSSPLDNPFISQTEVAPEIWAYGFRHPQHFSWDARGRMFINDIGEWKIEEINLGIAGGNYGWPLREGTFGRIYELVYSRILADVILPFTPTFIYPVAQYDHDEGRAIGSGFVYQGKQIPQLREKYVFSDIVTGRVFYIDTHDLRPGEPTEIKELRLSFDGQERALIDVVGWGPDPTMRPRLRADARLGIDAAGELYLLTKRDGWIRKLVPVHRAEHNGH